MMCSFNLIVQKLQLVLIPLPSADYRNVGKIYVEKCISIKHRISTLSQKVAPIQDCL